MSVFNLYPTINPTLSFDFVNARALDPSITFGRNTSATYFDETGILRVAGANTPRLDYNPSTLAAQGLLIEEARTNLLTYSEQFDNVIWGPVNGTVTANATTAPSGAVTADRGVTSGVQFQVMQGATITSGATVSGSVFLKADGINEVELVLLAANNTTPYARATFNVLTGVISVAVSTSNGGTNASASITAINNGWYRCVVTVTYPATTSAGMRIAAAGATGGIFLWGAQLEAGAFPTSYIPTTTIALTRSADVASVNTLSPWYNATEGGLYVEWQSNPTAYARYLVSIEQAASSATRIDININSVNAVNPRTVVSGAAVASLTGGTYTGGGIAKIAFGYKSADYASSLNGAAAVTATTVGALPSSLATMYLGSITGGTQVNGWLRRLTFYPRRPSNAELVALST